ILLALAVPTGAVYYLAFTQDGARFLFRQIPHKIGGTQLDVTPPTGTISRGIRVARVEIDHHLVHLRFDDVQVRVELLPLLLQTIRIKDGSIDSILVQGKHRTKPPIPSEPLFLPRWLIVNAERLHLASV